ELLHHLGADSGTPVAWVNCEIQDMQLGFVKLIDHEADNLFALFGHHADAVALSQAAQEIFFGPGKLEAVLFSLQDFGHVAANHPAYMDTNLFFLCSSDTHVPTPPLATKHDTPSMGTPCLVSRV